MSRWQILPTTRRMAVALTALALVLSACGSEDAAAPDAVVATETRTGSGPTTPSASETSTTAPSPAGQEQGEVVDAALVDFAIELDEESFEAGTHEFAVTNAGDASHDFVVERDGEDVAATEVLQPGQSGSVTVDLEPGTYVFYCSVGNHRAMGMEVTVEVT